MLIPEPEEEMCGRKFISVLGMLAASMALLNLAGEPGQTQIVDRTEAELVMRRLMPTTVRCEKVLWEKPFAYCRYETAKLADVIFEISVGNDGPAGSLTYNVGNAEGRQHLQTVQLFFSKVGIQDKLFAECIQRSRKNASEVLAGDLKIQCRYANFAGRISYEIFAERDASR